MSTLHLQQSTAFSTRAFSLYQAYFRTAISIAALTLGAEVSASNVTLEWDPVDDTRVALYEVHWGTESGQYNSTQQVTSTSATIDGLEEGETYFLAAKACDQSGEFCSDFSEELSKTVDYTPPVANFSENKTSGTGSLTVTFDDSSEGKIDSYHWDFGDGSSSTAATAVHTYDSVGTYTVNLTVTGPGGTVTKTKTDLITVSASDSGDNSGTDSGPSPGDDSIADAEFVTNPMVGSPEIPVEAGEITLDDEWKRVDFERSFIDPVVVSTSVSNNDDDPVTVRIAAVDQTGFFIRLQEWDYLDGQHSTENVGYLVVERGSYQLPNGAWLEADEIPVGTGDSWQFGSFIAPFATSPVVMSSVATYNDASPVVTRLQGIGPTGFELMMQGSEASSIAHATEMVSYVAWEASCSEINGYQFTVGKTANHVSHNPVRLGFTDQCGDTAKTFTTPPMLLTEMQTTDGPDTANLRWRKGILSARVWVDEEQSRDDEVSHTSEVAGYFAIGDTTDIDDPTIPADAPLTIEVGEVEVGDAWYRIDLDQDFSDPIVIAKLMSAYDADPATIRIKDVDPTGFTLRVQEWDYLDDRHGLERVSYMVVERGRHQLPNGDWIIADQLTSATTGFTENSFGHTFQATPVVITSVASENDPAAVTTRVKNITPMVFETGLSEQESSDQVHAPETIHYIALEPSTFAIDDITVEVDRTADAINHSQTEIDFAAQGAQLPLFLGDMQSTDGADTSALRVDQVDHGIATIWVEEEQSRDTEIAHTAETAGYFVIY